MSSGREPTISKSPQHFLAASYRAAEEGVPSPPPQPVTIPAKSSNANFDFMFVQPRMVAHVACG
jgi:hypothetical protein